MANKIIDSLTYGSDNYTFTIPFGTCATRAQDPDKEVVCPNFTALEAGARIAVLFEEGNDAREDLTLNVNQLGPIDIAQSPYVEDHIPSFPWYSVIEFILYKFQDGYYTWEPITDFTVASALECGAIIPAYADHAELATGVATGTSPNGLTADYLGVLATQNSCFALGAKVANTDSEYPPFLVSKTASTTSVNVYADTLLKRHPGLRFSTEWYSGDWDGASYATGEYVITNDSPFPITVYFNLNGVFGYGNEFQTASSSRITKTLDPGETVSGDADVNNPWGAGAGQLASNYPTVVVEAIGYDTSDMY